MPRIYSKDDSSPLNHSSDDADDGFVEVRRRRLSHRGDDNFSPVALNLHGPSFRVQESRRSGDSPRDTLSGRRSSSCSHSQRSPARRLTNAIIGNLASAHCRNSHAYDRRATEFSSRSREDRSWGDSDFLAKRMSLPPVQYEIEKALKRRVDGVELRLSAKKQIDALHKRHDWAEMYVIRNMFVDLDKDFVLTDKVLDAVEDKERYRKPTALYSDEARKARGDSILKAHAERRRTLHGLELGQGRLGHRIKDAMLETMRENLKRILDQLDAAKANKKKNSSDENVDEEARLKKRAYIAREKFLNAILSSKSFDEGRIDLHTLNTQYAKKVVEERLKATHLDPRFYVVTGQGKHSKDKICIIALAVKEYLTANSIPFKEGEENHKGRIFITSNPAGLRVLSPSNTIQRTETRTNAGGWGQRRGPIR